jgi:hypothetical protein
LSFKRTSQAEGFKPFRFFIAHARVCPLKGHLADQLNTHMLIQEVTTPKPKTPEEQRVTALKSQLDQARESARRQRLAARQARLNQERAALNKSFGQTKTPAL